MSEKANENNPKIVDTFKDVLSSSYLSNALDFTDFLKEIGMTFVDNRFYYMEEPTCLLLCFEHESCPSGYWGIYDCPIMEYEGFPLEEDLQEFARANVRICQGECGCDVPRGGKCTIFGKEFDDVCSSNIVFHMPDSEALVKIKKLMLYWKLIISNSKKSQI